MIARGFRSVAWVAAVGGAALGCYILSLQVATERAELARVERLIIDTKQEIRSLQTELGTRGRLSQLEQWNSDVLALSAPASKQFLRSEFTLARLERREPTLEERSASIHMASSEVVTKRAPAPMPARAIATPAAAPNPIVRAVAQAPAEQRQAQPAARLQQASFTPSQPKKPALRIDADFAAEIGAAARAEKKADKGAQASTKSDRKRTEPSAP